MSATHALLLMAFVTACVWAAVLVQALGSRRLSGYGTLATTIWTAAIAGSLLTVARRSGSFSDTPILFAGTAIILGLFAITALGTRPERGGPHRMLVVWTLALTVVEVLYLTQSSARPTAHLPEVAALAFLPGIALQVRASGATKDQLLRLALRVSLVVTVGSVILGFVAPAAAYSRGISDVRRVPLPFVDGRLGGLTPHPNLLSITALMCILLAIRLRPKGWRLMIVMSLLAMLLAESRVAVATLALVLVTWFVLAAKNRIGRAIIVSPVVVFSLAQLGNLAGSTDGDALTSDLSTNGRLRIWGIVWERLQAHPLEGFGPLAFQEDSGSPYLAAGLLHAHNQVLQGAAEAGIIGALITVCLLASIAYIGIKYHRDPIYPTMAIVILASAVTEPFLTLHLYGLNYAIVPALLLFVVLMSAGREESPAPKDDLEDEVTESRTPAGSRSAARRARSW